MVSIVEQSIYLLLLVSTPYFADYIFDPQSTVLFEVFVILCNASCETIGIVPHKNHYSFLLDCYQLILLSHRRFTIYS
jgi:hypothetical protein